MDEGSEIDWTQLDNQLADVEGLANCYQSAEFEEALEVDEPNDFQDEVLQSADDLDVQNQDALIEACQKYLEIQVDEIEELALPTAWASELQGIWQEYLQKVGGRLSAGEAIYDAILEAAPSVVMEDFGAPRTVWSSRFGDGLSSLIVELSDMQVLRRRAEAMGFSHLFLAVTESKCELFRDVIVSVIEQEMGPEQFPVQGDARRALVVVLNYIAGALLYSHDVYATRVKSIEKSWRQANKKPNEHDEIEEEKSEGQASEMRSQKLKVEEVDKEKFHDFSKAAKSRRKGLNVPKTFNQMFLFNSCVMGYEDSEWMDLVLDQFDAMASNVTQLHRLQEECDVLSIMLTKYLNQINYSEFKTVLLATLRALVKDWNSDMDVAWNWFWDRLEALLMDRKTLLMYQKKLQSSYHSIDERCLHQLQKRLFHNFFLTMPRAQDYLKTSMTRLYFVADRIFEMSLELYNQPRQMVQDITGIGLMHVGMNIPREFFKPFAAAAARTFQELIQHDAACHGFSWSISLISRVMERVVAEGSTVVMKAVCLNDELKLHQAMQVAPRCERAEQLVAVSAGGQSTSPLYWAIDSGAFSCAHMMIQDLLTIRADRENYYYGCDQLFDVHQDLIFKLCTAAPILLQPLLDGLVWRSRSTVNNQRRVNYFIKNLVQDKEGGFSKSLGWIVNSQDPKAISHPASALAVNLVWSGLAVRYFLLSRGFFLLSLMAFMAGQSVYVHHDGTESFVDNVVVASCRGFNYFLSMTFLIYDHLKHLYVDLLMGQLERTSLVPIPKYLLQPRHFCSLMLTCTLVLMIILEPILWCLGELSIADSPFQMFTSNCSAGKQLKDVYSVCASFAALLFWALLTDWAVFSVRLYAFLLVCGAVIMEVMLFLAAVLFLILSFATALNALDHTFEHLDGVPTWIRTLSQIVLQMIPTSFYYGLQSNGTVFFLVSLFVGLVTFWLVNLLIVQLMEAYQNQHEDLQGHAQLSRAGIVVQIMEQVHQSSWNSFLESLQFEEPLEFNEGDIGLPGGVQVLEHAHANIVTTDRIHRYGGSTSPSLPWPEPEKKKSLRQERFQRVENLFLKASNDKAGKTGTTAFGRKAQKKRSLTFNNAMAMFNSSLSASEASSG